MLHSAFFCFFKASLSTQLQIDHQERISNERYACIFRNLAKFDKMKQLSILKYPNPHIRAALSRALFKLNKNSKKNSFKLLCLTANLAWNLSTIKFPTISFNGLKQSNKYRESILNGLWNYQLLNNQCEQLFNQSLKICSICSLFNSNKKFENDSRLKLRCLLMLDKRKFSKHFLQCYDCHVRVHEECYEYLCLALNIQINDQYEQWICQRCSLRREVSFIFFC